LGEEENETSVDHPSTSSNGCEHSTNEAPTFLMYNKISTTISGKESPTLSANGGGLNSNENQKSNSKSDKKKNEKNRESAVWYESILNFKKVNF
jgi:hypothetical protein